MRRIKKYSNRRLYDSTSSSYINIEELIQFVRDGEEVEIIEDTTGKDITNNILLQSILETNATVQLFPKSLLHRLIRVQSKDDLQGALSNRIAAGLQLLDAQLAKLEGSNWMNMSSWNPFAQNDQPTPQKESEDTVSEENEAQEKEEPFEETTEDIVDTESTPIEVVQEENPEPEEPKRSVAEQQLDNIRAHIASLEARLRKK